MPDKKGIFTKETFAFFRDLERNNRKEWMHENRDRYEDFIVAPFRRLLEELTPAVRKLNPAFDTGGRTGQNFSRINRDIRFARDKTPYRAQMYLMFSEPAPKGSEAGQFYVGVTSAVVTAGFRIFGERKRGPLAELARPRARENFPWLTAQAKKLGRVYESYWHLTEKKEWNKREGWPLTSEEWEKLQAWIVRKKMKPAEAARPDFVRTVEKVFKDLMPLWRMTSARDWKAGT
jgi:uncharacterized protein (TIGR02453 family)